LAVTVVCVLLAIHWQRSDMGGLGRRNQERSPSTYSNNKQKTGQEQRIVVPRSAVMTAPFAL